MIYQPPLRGKKAFFLSIRDNQTFISHWHKEVEVIYCISGGISLMVEGEFYKLTENQMILINSSEEHSVEYNPSKDSKVLLIEGGDALLGDQFKILTTNYFTKRILDLTPNLDPDPDIPEHAMKKIRFVVDQILREKMVPECKNSEENYWYLMGYCYELIASLYRYVPMRERTDEQILKRVHYYNIIRPVVDYVEKHYSESIPIQKAASLVCYERTSFCRIFHSVTGITFLEYLNRHRVENAKAYLVDGEKSIGEIGKLCGIPNSKSFTRIFRQYAGMLPSEYQKAFAKKNGRVSHLYGS